MSEKARARQVTSAVTEPDAEATWSFPPSLTTPREARAVLGLRLLVWGVDARAGTTVLHVVNELVTNAVEHAGTEVELSVRLTGPSLTVGVRDGSAEAPRLIDTTADGHGWGLRLVAGLSRRWWWESSARPPGKTVWAEIPVK